MHNIYVTGVIHFKNLSSFKCFWLLCAYNRSSMNHMMWSRKMMWKQERLVPCKFLHSHKMYITPIINSWLSDIQNTLIPCFHTITRPAELFVSAIYHTFNSHREEIRAEYLLYQHTLTFTSSSHQKCFFSGPQKCTSQSTRQDITLRTSDMTWGVRRKIGANTDHFFLLHGNSLCGVFLGQMLQLIRQLCGDIEGLPIIPCSFGFLYLSSKYKCNTPSDIAYWTAYVYWNRRQWICC